MSQGLTDMRGATAPRLLLELMCARVLLPGADDSAEGLGARIDRLERRMSVVGDVSAGTTTGSRPPAPSAAPTDAPEPAASIPTASTPTASTPAASEVVTAPAVEHVEPAAQPQVEEVPPEPAMSGPAAAITAPTASEPTISAPADEPAAAEPAAASEGAAPSGLSLVDVRQLWPGVLERVSKLRRATWAGLSSSSQVKDVRDGILTLAVTEGFRKNFQASGHDEILHQAMIDELGVDWRIETVVDESVGKGPRGSARDPGSASAPRPAAAAPVEPAPVAEPATPVSPPDWAVGPEDSAAPGAAAGAAGPDPDVVPEDTAADGAPQPGRPVGVSAAKEAIRKTRSGREGEASESPESPEIRDDDDVIDDATLSGHELLARELGAKVIDDIRHDR